MSETQKAIPDAGRRMLGHTVATLAYRGAKAVRDAPAGFADFRVSAATRTPTEILAHIGDLLEAALSVAQGNPSLRESKPLPWEQEVGRFFSALEALDGYLASTDTLQAPPERLFQGPIADALTHVGQLALLRRLAGAPIPAENFFAAGIAAGRLTR